MKKRLDNGFGFLYNSTWKVGNGFSLKPQWEMKMTRTIMTVGMVVGAYFAGYNDIKLVEVIEYV